MKKKGISLIVLIITIVVIIILAAAVILTMSKNNPIESAKKSVFVSDLSSYQDELSMYIGKKYIDTDGSFNIATLDGEALESVVDINDKYKDKFAIKDGRIAGTEELVGQEKDWADVITGGAVATLNVPFNYTDSKGKKVFLPKDFEVSTVASEQNVDTGLVIKDKKGNEFVWVPVEFKRNSEFETKFLRKEGYYNNAPQSFLNLATEPLNYEGVVAIQSEVDEYKAMVESVKKYHGYFIARYEGSIDGTGSAQSKPNFSTHLNMKWGNDMTDLTGGVVEKARALHPVANATEDGSAVSTLIYGVQWDTALDFIENYGVKDATYRKVGTGKGNYNAAAINTGTNPAYSFNNIYDMAGNMWEWTMEAYGNTARVYRGGSCLDDGPYYPASHRGGSAPTYPTYNRITFRMALYIK